jgi:hypothetical protein
MKAVITVAITVDVPEETDLESFYLGLPIEQIEILSLHHDQPVDATVERYETVDVRGEGEHAIRAAASPCKALNSSKEDAMNDCLAERELATVLAALRFWQQELARNGNEPPICGHFQDGATPLTVEGIDELCERLNLGHDAECEPDRPVIAGDT